MIQKPFVLILLLGVSAFGFTQSIDSSTFHNNSFGIILNSRVGIQYKRNLNKITLRSSLNSIGNPEGNAMNQRGIPNGYNNKGFNETTIYVADTFVIKRIEGNYSRAFDFRLGAEKIVVDKKINLVTGADAAIGLLSRNKYYLDAFEYYSTDSLTGITTFVPCDHFANSQLTTGQSPNCEIPEEYQYLVRNGTVEYRYLKLAGQLSIAAGVDLNAKFRLAAQITPEFAYYKLQSESENDPKNLYSAAPNFSQFSWDNVNFILEYSF